MKKLKVPLAVNPLGWREKLAAIKVILGDRVTQGPKVREFEEAFARRAGRKYAVMVNSGSSANLLAMRTLVDFGLLKRGDEVLTNAVTYSTSIAPIVDVGCVPVFEDVPTPYGISTAFDSVSISETQGILAVHLLGEGSYVPPNSKPYVEDCCECPPRRYGFFSSIATYSFYFSHHISTIEGGMVVTDNLDCSRHLRALREFGWYRFAPRFCFSELGYNLRATELQAAIGLEQLHKLSEEIRHRQRNLDYWNSRLDKYNDVIALPSSRKCDFRYPIILKSNALFTRDEFVKRMEDHGVETRPIMAGNVTEQPMARKFKYRTVGDLPNARWIHRNGFLWGNHTGIGAREREYVADVAEDFLKSKVKR